MTTTDAKTYADEKEIIGNSTRNHSAQTDDNNFEKGTKISIWQSHGDSKQSDFKL